MGGHHQDLYWDSRGVPKLPAEVAKLGKAQRRAWRTRYVQDLYIPDGLVGPAEIEWRARNTIHVLTGKKPQAASVPPRTVPSRPRPDSNAQNVNTSQKVAPKASAKLATPELHLGTTRLCIPPQKRWHNADGSEWQPPTRDTNVIKNTRLATPELHLGITRLCIPPQKRWHNADGSEWQPPTWDTNAIKNTGHDGDQLDEAAKPWFSLPALQSGQNVVSQPSLKRQKIRHIIYPPATERKLSSIPDNLGWSTGEETFKRVAAIVDRDSESDDEPSDVSSEDEVTDQPVVRGSVAESFAAQINESSPKVRNSLPNSQLRDKLPEAMATGDGYLSDACGLGSMSPVLTKMTDDQQLLDAVSPDPEALPTSSSDGHSKAHAESETPSRLAVSAGRDAGNFNVNAEQSTQEVYEAVEEVLEEVCSSTRALPSSRSTRARMRKVPLITKPYSRLGELVPESVIIQQGTASKSNNNDALDDEGSMADIGEEAGEADMEGVSTGSISEAGCNTIVACKSAPGSQGDDQDEEGRDIQRVRRPPLNSSSLLEELSQYPPPHPPPPPYPVEPQVPTVVSSNTAESQTMPASPRVMVMRTSASKRKMTGVTSKHFSRLESDESAGPALRQSRRNVAKNAPNAENQQVSMMFTNQDNASDDDVIIVTSRRRYPQPKTPSRAVPDVQKTASRRTPSTPRATSLAKKRIAYVDLTGPASKQLIAYVDLRGETADVRDQAPQPSPPNDKDEPLEHLGKLLKSPNFVKQRELVASKDGKGREPRGAVPTTPKRTPKKTTGTKSPHFITDRVDQYNTTSSSRRVPAGTSTVPFPALTCSAFGIIQEKLWQEPFWLLIAVTFLNKTTGRAAVPIFWKVKKLFPTPEELAQADPEVLLEMVRTLGLQNARSKRLVNMAVAWVASPPAKGRTFRTLNYPCRGDGRASETAEFTEGDVKICRGSLEIGHIPGCGAYAYDSWRIFCRDVLRGVAEDYDGKGAASDGFEAEWKRVLPEDKELRACLRWMWLREGWVWNPLTGEKRLVEEGEDIDALVGAQVV